MPLAGLSVSIQVSEIAAVEAPAENEFSVPPSEPQSRRLRCLREANQRSKIGVCRLKLASRFTRQTSESGPYIHELKDHQFFRVDRQSSFAHVRLSCLSKPS